jgi:hypothetical protein
MTKVSGLVGDHEKPCLERLILDIVRLIFDLVQDDPAIGSSVARTAEGKYVFAVLLDMVARRLKALTIPLFARRAASLSCSMN